MGLMPLIMPPVLQADSTLLPAAWARAWTGRHNGPRAGSLLLPTWPGQTNKTAWMERMLFDFLVFQPAVLQPCCPVLGAAKCHGTASEAVSCAVSLDQVRMLHQ